MTQTKRSYVSDRNSTANASPMSLALRQLQATLRGPVFWTIVGAAVLLTALAGPYYTMERLSFAERLVYWGITIPLSAISMAFLSALARHIAHTKSLHWAVIAVLTGLLGVIPIVASVYLSESIATGFETAGTDVISPWRLSLYVAPSVIGVTLCINALFAFKVVGNTVSDAPVAAPAPTLLQSKLPPHLGQDIIAVQAQDHYVEVTTTKGSVMVLMRLSDAVRDLEPLGGLQVHRSWWVNLSHLVRVETGKSGQELVMQNGPTVPVGRSFRAALKAALV